MRDLLEPQDAEHRSRPLVRPEPKVEQAPPVLLFERVSKWYGPVLGLNQVTLELRPGITGLVGHNGAGKSTLLQLAAGHLRPDLGRVTLNGLDAWTSDAKLHVGYCPDLDQFYEDLSGRDFLLVLARLTGFSQLDACERVEDLLRLVGMHDRADRALAGYSKGMRQRIKLAQALIHDPALLLLDEPLSGIDPVGRREMVALFLELARQGKCLLISSHELDELEKLTDQVAILAAGRIAAVGALPRIRELLDQHPHAIRVSCEPSDVLTRHLWQWEEIVGIERDAQDLIVRARNPKRFFEKLSLLIIEENLEVRRIETLDESTSDVLNYLLGGTRA